VPGLIDELRGAAAGSSIHVLENDEMIFGGVRFLGCTLWFWRRNSPRAAGLLLLLFVFEAAAAPGLKHVMTVTKACDLALAIAGAGCALAVLVAARRSKRSSGRGLAEAG
jgi:hypothetical protein